MKRLFFSAVLSVFLLAPAIAGDEISWRPVTPEELQMKTPKVEADADAEAIFWEVRLDDKKDSKLYYNHYVRVKIFTERGREKFSKFDIPFTKGKKVENVAARVIKPDGSIINLNPGDIFEREIVKAGKIKILAKSFAVPGIEPGVIVEYQYREIYKGDNAGGEKLIFQRDIPLQKAVYSVRPDDPYSLRYHYYNMPETRFEEDPARKGYYVATMTNVPAFKEEPYMPPDDEVRRWVYLSYSSGRWSFLSMVYGELLREVSKPTKELKQKTAEIINGASTDDEKLHRLYDFAQKQIRNLSFDKSLTEEQAENIKFKNAGDVLKNWAGNTPFIDLLFASMARTAGFDVSIVLTGDRSELFFAPEKYPFLGFVVPSSIAIKVGNETRYFNPGIPYIPYGQLRWQEEAIPALLINEGGYVWKKTSLTGYKRSLTHRTGKFKLLEDGTLEGTVTLGYDGHRAIARRRDDFNSSQTKREDVVREEIKAIAAAAEISDISIENFSDNSKPLIYNLKVRVPNYAQKTGKRMFFQPGFFEYGSSPVFTSSTRIHGIYFPYPWSEQDVIEIELPKGFELENAESPAEVSDSEKITSLKISIGIDKTSNVLFYHRNFYFGDRGNIAFTASIYPVMKRLFDDFNKADTWAIALKQKQ